MIRLSVNLLTYTAGLLNRIESYSFSSVRELYQIMMSEFDPEEVFLLACDCNWADISLSGQPLMTDQGKKISCFFSEGQYSSYLRIMLENYIASIRPTWSNRIPYGRKESTIFMSKDEQACFYEANLLDDPPTEDVIQWWDKIAESLRKQQDEKKNAIGRKGEQITVEYEKKRTETDPKWVSIDSNLSGYDIKSIVSKKDRSPLLIEVKTSSEDMSNAWFHITANEWLTAQTSKQYIFYLWCLSDRIKRLAKLFPEMVKPYIPTNNLSGEWESVCIPFAVFTDKFTEI